MNKKVVEGGFCEVNGAKWANVVQSGVCNAVRTLWPSGMCSGLLSSAGWLVYIGLNGLTLIESIEGVWLTFGLLARWLGRLPAASMGQDAGRENRQKWSRLKTETTVFHYRLGSRRAVVCASNAMGYTGGVMCSTEWEQAYISAK